MWRKFANVTPALEDFIFLEMCPSLFGAGIFSLDLLSEPMVLGSYGGNCRVFCLAGISFFDINLRKQSFLTLLTINFILSQRAWMHLRCIS